MLRALHLLVRHKVNNLDSHWINFFALALTANAVILVHAEDAVGTPITVIKGLAATEGHNVVANNGTRSHQLLGVNYPAVMADMREAAQAEGIAGLILFGACPIRAFKETSWYFMVLPCPGWAPKTSQMGRTACGCVSGQRHRPHAVL